MTVLIPALEQVDENLYEANITQGRLWAPTELGVSTGDGSAIVTTNLQARLEFRTKPGGLLLASMATTGGGSADGTITVVPFTTTTAKLRIRLPSAKTQTMTPGSDSTSANEQVGVGDLKVWSTDYESGEPFGLYRFALRVWPEVTA